MIPVARGERVRSVRVNVLDFSVTSVNDEASSFPFSHRLAKLYSVFLARELLSGLTRSDCGYQPTARFRYDVQRSDDVANPCQVYFTGSGCRLYFSFLRLHKSQTTTFRRLRKLGRRQGDEARSLPLLPPCIRTDSPESSWSGLPPFHSFIFPAGPVSSYRRNLLAKLWPPRGGRSLTENRGCLGGRCLERWVGPAQGVN